MSGVSMCRVVWVGGRGGGLGGYQPGVYVPLKALFLVFLVSPPTRRLVFDVFAKMLHLPGCTDKENS